MNNKENILTEVEEDSHKYIKEQRSELQQNSL